jgi:putative tricarboxylic transport membrane protein
VQKARSGAVLKGELLFSVLVFLVSLVLYWVTGSFEGRTVLQNAQMGPAFWPRFILICLMILSVVVSVGAIRRLGREKAWGESLMTMDRGKVRFFSAIGLIVVYLFLLEVTGFVITTPVFMIAFMLLLGEKSKGWIIGVSLAMTGIIVVLFTKAMYVPLPRGVWLFREFSLLFY